MKIRLDKTLRFWVDCSYEDRKHENANRTRAELIAEILREYEQSGDAMRHLNAKGQHCVESFARHASETGRRRTGGRGRHGGITVRASDDCG